MFLSSKSKNTLVGVKTPLVSVVNRAIEITAVDFRVLEGVRTLARQKQLVASGASKTLDSKHLTGDAVDLGALVGGQISWDWPLYYKIAEAMRDAANELGVTLVWGGVWDKTLNSLGDIDDEVLAYQNRRKALGKKAFLDGPHYQLG